MNGTMIRRTAAVAVTAATLTGLVLTAGPAGAQTRTHRAPRCGNAALTVTRTFVQGAAGHSGMALIYRNATTRTCSVTGYPGLDAVTAKGRVLTHAVRVGSAKRRTVTIRPGHFASATVQWRNIGKDGRDCRRSAAIRTIVANTTRVHRLPVAVGACGLRVGRTVAGVPGYPHYAQAQFDWITIASVDDQGRQVYLRDVVGQLKAARVYPTQYAQARQLASFPATGLTHEQLEHARADVKALNAFFATLAV